ncbi:uncharacterized protein AAEQ78_019368 isoform 3-T10 [Lycaon pictus]
MLSDRATGVKPRVPAVGTPASTLPPAATESSGFGLRSNSQVVWRLQCRLHVSSVPPQAERASALRRNQICPTTPSRRELLEQQVEELVPALLRLDNPFLFEFLNVLEEYGTPEEVLDLLFAKKCQQVQVLLQELPMAPRTELTAPQGSGLVRGQRVTAAMRRDRVHRTIHVMPPALLWISMHCSFLQEGRNPGPLGNHSSTSESQIVGISHTGDFPPRKAE